MIIPLDLAETDAAMVRDLAKFADGAKAGYAAGWNDALKAMAMRMADRKKAETKTQEGTDGDKSNA